MGREKTPVTEWTCGCRGYLIGSLPASCPDHGEGQMPVEPNKLSEGEEIIDP